MSKKLTRDTVIQAIKECNQIGEVVFLSSYGFGKARKYYLVFEGKQYPSKAIYGVAFKSMGPEFKPKKSNEFSGGLYGAAGELKKLGFEIIIKK
jgi:5-methylcytosine-specific restriction protein A